MTKKKRIIQTICFIIIALAYDCFVYYFTRILAEDKVHYSLDTPLDHLIPLVPWMVVIYFGCYLFWLINYIIGLSADSHNAHRYLLAHLVGETVCFILFTFFPTIITRPEITGQSIWDSAIRYLYSIDAPNNLFPSVHCLVSWICWAGIRRLKAVPVWYRWFSLLFALTVCVSTLTVKQHFIADAICGVVLAELSFHLADLILKLASKRKHSLSHDIAD